eukprot:c37140_g1_i1 orf=1-459(-)
MHKTSRESLRFPAKYTPCCGIQEKLIRRSLQTRVPSTEDKHGYFSLKKTSTHEEEIVNVFCVERTTTMADKIHHKSQQTDHEEVCFVNNSNHHIYHEDTLTPAFLVSLLKESAENKDLHSGCQIHSAIVKRGLLWENMFLGSALVNMYAKCGA